MLLCSYKLVYVAFNKNYKAELSRGSCACSVIPQVQDGQSYQVGG